MARRIILDGISRPEIAPWGTMRMYWLLEQWMVENLGFEIWPALDTHDVKSNLKPLPRDTEVIYMHLALHRFTVKEVVDYIKTCPDAAVIFIPGGDRRTWGIDKVVNASFFERVSVILDNQKESWPEIGTFADSWPQHAHKHIFFGGCISPASWYDWEYNELPIHKCILSGRVGGRYELRNFALAEMTKDAVFQNYVDVLRYPPYYKPLGGEAAIRQRLETVGRLSPVDDIALKGMTAYKNLRCINDGPGNLCVVKDAYQDVLHQYLGGLAIVGNHLNQVVITKHIEVMTVGSLMISERFKDLDRMGFIPNRHYVEVTRENLVRKVKYICRNPEEYAAIRRQGMAFVRRHHRLEQRQDWMREIVDNILSGKEVVEMQYV